MYSKRLSEHIDTYAIKKSQCLKLLLTILFMIILLNSEREKKLQQNGAIFIYSG